MIRLVAGLCLLFLGMAMATALVVHVVRRKRAVKRLSRPFKTKKHAGTESTYWQKRCAPDVTKAVTRTSGHYVPIADALQSWAYSGPALRPEAVTVSMPVTVSVPVEEWRPKHPLGWRVVKVDALYYAVSSRCPADVQRYSPSMLGWVKEEDLGAWGEAVWASLGMPEGPA